MNAPIHEDQNMAMIPILQQNTGGEDNNGDPLEKWGHHAEVPEVDDYEEDVMMMMILLLLIMIICQQMIYVN